MQNFHSYIIAEKTVGKYLAPYASFLRRDFDGPFRTLLKFINVLLEPTLGICNKLTVYAYDAYLIQCALTTNTSLLTLDNRLSAAAEKLGVKTLEI